MAVAAYDRYGVLAAQGRNPAIIRRNWRSGSFQFGANGTVGKRRPFVHVQNLKFRQILGQPPPHEQRVGAVKTAIIASVELASGWCSRLVLRTAKKNPIVPTPGAVWLELLLQ